MMRSRIRHKLSIACGQWTLIRTFFSEILASISHRNSLKHPLEFSSHEDESSLAERLDLFMKTTDSSDFFLVCSSSCFTRS
ncbi:hypothetical protein LguiB_019304 [Lonicera macranthoides]